MGSFWLVRVVQSLVACVVTLKIDALDLTLTKSDTLLHHISFLTVG